MPDLMSKRFWPALALLAWLPLTSAGAEFAASKPTPRVEYWETRLKQINEMVANRATLPQVKLLFVGDSITDFWLLDDNPWVKGQKFGRRIWNESFNTAGSANFGLNIGISGDRTEHVLYRLQPRARGGLGQIDAPELEPEFIVLMIGINNTWAPEEPVQDSVFDGASAVIQALEERKPRARMILQSLLPLPEADKNRDIVRPINSRLQALSRSRPQNCILYLDLYDAFVDAKGHQIHHYFNDGIHPNEVGYRVWRDRLVAALEAARMSPVATPCH
jgi:lysophospholipase L1-like esterase